MGLHQLGDQDVRHFLKIGEVDPLPALIAIQAKPELWNQFDLRTTHPQSPHTDCDDVWLWFNEFDPAEPATAIDTLQTVKYPAWAELPQLRTMVLDLIRRVDGVQLGRCIITRLPPGGRITPHVDEGAPASYFRRFQIALQSLPGTSFRIEDETVNFRSGEVWMINNRAEHEVVNNSADDRIVVIVDVRLADD